VETQPQGVRWARILTPTQTYSVTNDPLWIAQVDELYYVVAVESGQILGVWDGDTQFWQVWFDSEAAQILNLNKQPPALADQPYIHIFQPVAMYSLEMDPVGVAEPPADYPVLRHEDGWTLAIADGMLVWIQDGPQTEYETSDLAH
jgi:hypothetical protein